MREAIAQASSSPKRVFGEKRFGNCYGYAVSEHPFQHPFEKSPRDGRTNLLDRIAVYLLHLEPFLEKLREFRGKYAIPSEGFALETTLSLPGRMLARRVHGFYDAWRRCTTGQPQPGDSALVEALGSNVFRWLQSEEHRERLGGRDRFGWVDFMDYRAEDEPWGVKPVNPALYAFDLERLEEWRSKVEILEAMAPLEWRALLLDLIYQPVTLLKRLETNYKRLYALAVENPPVGLLHTFTELYPDAELELDERGREVVGLKLLVKPGVNRNTLERLVADVERVVSLRKFHFRDVPPLIPKRANKTQRPEEVRLLLAELARVHSGDPIEEVMASAAPDIAVEREPWPYRARLSKLEQEGFRLKEG